MSHEDQQNVPPKKKKNSDMREKEHLSQHEVRQLITAARIFGKANAERDALLIHLMYTHGLRTREVVRLVWDDIDLTKKLFQPRRADNGTNAPHSIPKRELQMLKGYKKRCVDGRYVFPSPQKKGSHLSERSVRRIVQIAGREAGLGSHIHPHMLRHSCGFALIKKGIAHSVVQAYMGHVKPVSTLQYTESDTDVTRQIGSIWD